MPIGIICTGCRKFVGVGHRCFQPSGEPFARIVDSALPGERRKIPPRAMYRVACVHKTTLASDDLGAPCDLREWCERPQNVYIGQMRMSVAVNKDGSTEPYPAAAPIWSNPFQGTCSPEEAQRKYRAHVSEEISAGRLDIADIVGKRLGCYCRSPYCHGEVLLDLIHQYRLDHPVYVPDPSQPRPEQGAGSHTTATVVPETRARDTECSGRGPAEQVTSE